MTSSRKSFFDWWRTKKDREDLQERTNRLRLNPSQLGLLLGNAGVRAALQETRTGSLLPPIGTEVFIRLTAQQQQQQQQQQQDASNTNLKPANELEAGKPLPFFYGAPPPELLNTPLVDPDPFYQSQDHKTFIVVSRGNIIHRFDAESSLYLLSHSNRLRIIAIQILIHSLFRFFMMATILMNCVVIAMNPGAWSRTMHRVFTALYTAEVLIKVLSRGFCLRRFSFLRDPWNWLDVMAVVLGFVTEFVHVRYTLDTVPRVLKILPLLPGMKTTVRALVQSVKGLLRVAAPAALGLGFLALIGLQVFMGVLQQKCVEMPETEDYYNYTRDPENYYFLHGSINPLMCGNSSDSGVCPNGTMCLKVGNNPDYGFTSFDSFGWSLLSVVRFMTHDLWEDLVLMVVRTKGQHSLLFFMGIVFPASFCLLSLAVAAVAMAICEEEEASAAELRQREEEFGRVLEAIKRKEEEEDGTGDDKKSKEGLDQDRCCGCDRKGCGCDRKCCGCDRKCSGCLFSVVSSPFFDFAVIVCIVVNIVFMSMDHFPLTHQFYEILSTAHLVFTGIFIVEVLLRISALGLRRYFQVSWNIFDCIIVVFSLVELMIAAHVGWILLLRVFRLARWWPALRLLLKVMWASVRSLRNLTVVLLVLVFLFTVLGLQLFQQDFQDHVCRISADCRLNRWHMADFFHAFLVVFRVLCGGWIESLWDCMEVSGPASCLIYFLVVLVLGNLLVLQLFLTLLLNSFSSDSLTDLEERNNFQLVIKRLLGKKSRDPDPPVEVDGKVVNSKDYVALTFTDPNQQIQDKGVNGNHGNLTDADTPKTPGEEIHKSKLPEVDEERRDSPEDCCSQKCYGCCPLQDVDPSQRVWRVWTKFRTSCLCVVQHRSFDSFFIVIVLLNSAALACEDVHLEQRPVLKAVLLHLDRIVSILFLLEMLLKWAGLGLKRYFTDGWCWLDFLILQVSLVTFAADMFGLGAFGSKSSLRTLRALGPLRALSRCQGVKVVIRVLVRSGRALVSVLVVSAVVWLVFSALGVSLFAGRFFRCVNVTSDEAFSELEISNMSECLDLGLDHVIWVNAPLTFDHVGGGFLSLLHMAAADDYFEFLFPVVDSGSVMSQPSFEGNMSGNFFFISFIIVSSFFTFNFFIRVFIDDLQGHQIGNQIFMTEQQHKFFQTLKKRLMKPKKPIPRPQCSLQARLYDLVTERPFQVLVLVLIFLYLVSLALWTDQQSKETEVILYWIDFVFILLFLIELLLKMAALRRHFFTAGWNIFHFVVIVFSIFGLFVADLIEKYFVAPQLFILMRGIAVLRALYFLRPFRKLFLSLMMSLPALFNIGLLLFILTFVSSLLGMFNFAHVEPEELIGDVWNFQTFGGSAMCLISVTSWSSWGRVLQTLLNAPPYCDPDVETADGFPATGTCGRPALAIFLFTVHVLVSFLLAVCLYLAVVMETFNPDEDEGPGDEELQEDAVEMEAEPEKASP